MRYQRTQPRSNPPIYAEVQPHQICYLYGAFYSTLLPVRSMWPLVFRDTRFMHLNAERGLGQCQLLQHGAHLYPSLGLLGTLQRPFSLIEHGLMKCSCRWSTYSSTFRSIVPETEMQSIKLSMPFGIKNAGSLDHYAPQMNDILAQSHTTCMGADDNSKFGCHQEHTQNLTNTRKSARVNLTNIDSFGLKQLLECHPIVSVFSCSHSYSVGFQSLADGRMTQDIIRGGGFFNEPIYT